MSAEGRPTRTTPPAPPPEDDSIELEVLEPDGSRSRVICAAIEPPSAPVVAATAG